MHLLAWAWPRRGSVRLSVNRTMVRFKKPNSKLQQFEPIRPVSFVIKNKRNIKYLSVRYMNIYIQPITIWISNQLNS